MNAQNISKEMKVLIEIYRLFYRENPNFSDKNINIKIQTMMVILFHFGLSFGIDYGFHFLSSKKLPISFNLQEDIKNLYQIGEVTDNKFIELSKDTKRIIKNVSDILFKEALDSNDTIELATSVSQVIYVREYCLQSTSGISEMASFLNLPVEEVEKNSQLVKQIENKFPFFSNRKS